MRIFTKKNAAVVAVLGLAGSPAFAAIDTTALETAVLADIGLAVAFGFTLLAASLGGSIGISLVKKFGQKGAA